MQIGQILVEQRWVEPAALARALAEQRHTGKRICSLLIARGLLEPDDAVRGLANQHNVPGVLQRHLENRDRSLAALLPAAIARASLALPIGWTRDHELIVCVRDPRPELRQAVASAVGVPVVIVVAPASQLEALIEETYRGGVTTPVPRHNKVRVDHGEVEVEVEIDLNTRAIPVIGGKPEGEDGEITGLGDLGSMTLVELDDDRVARDPTQSGALPVVAPGTLTSSPLPKRAMTTQRRATSPGLRATTARLPAASSGLRGTAPKLRAIDEVERRGLGTALPSPKAGRTSPVGSIAGALAAPDLEAAIAAVDQAAAPSEASDAAMGYVAQRFHHAVLFSISQGLALGDRGHGGQLTTEVLQTISIPLSAPSIVQAAHDTRRPQVAAPRQGGVIQDRLARTLGSPQTLAAIPIEVDARVAYVLAVGDRTGAHDPATRPVALAELERLTAALGAAYQRLARR